LAKKKSTAATVSKSDAIREVLAARPKASVKDVQASLGQKGIKASDALVNKIKYRRKSSKRPRRGEKNGSSASKADAIRGMFEKMGRNARPRDIIAALKARGVVVTSAQVSTLRRKAPRAGAFAGSVPYEHLLAAKALAERLGGIEKARQALNDFAKLVEA
jgi:hypothetical protein